MKSLSFRNLVVLLIIVVLWGEYGDDTEYVMSTNMSTSVTNHSTHKWHGTHTTTYFRSDSIMDGLC